MARISSGRHRSGGGPTLHQMRRVRLIILGRSHYTTNFFVVELLQSHGGWLPTLGGLVVRYAATAFDFHIIHSEKTERPKSSGTNDDRSAVR